MLERSCFELYDSLAELKRYIESAGLKHVCLSGSGSCIYSIFDSRDESLVTELQRNLNSRYSCESVIVSNNRW